MFCTTVQCSNHEVYLQPTSIEEELQQCENRDVHVYSVSIVLFVGVQKLSTNDAECKK